MEIKLFYQEKGYEMNKKWMFLPVFLNFIPS
jgi:hypothetical protein